MKKLIVSLAFLGVVGGLVWLVWFKPATHEEEAAKPPTEVPVHVAKITRATLRAQVTAYGAVEPEPSGERPAASARVAPSVPGIVTVVSCAEGQRVDKGAVLFQLDDRAVGAAVDKANWVAEYAANNLKRQDKLMEAGGTSQKLLLEASQAATAASGELAALGIQQALLRVQAPLAGVVTRVNIRPGEAVDLTTVLAEIIDLDRLVVAANVSSAEMAALKTGQAVEVVAASEAAPVKGMLTFISPQVDAKTGTVLVRVSVPANAGLRPGQIVTVRIASEEHKDRLAVPVASVVKDGEGGAVIALVQGDKATQKSVKTGLREGGLVEVEAEGLQEGMTVVTAGAYGLPKETKVRVVEEKAETERPKTEKWGTEK